MFPHQIIWSGLLTSYMVFFPYKPSTVWYIYGNPHFLLPLDSLHTSYNNNTQLDPRLWKPLHCLRLSISASRSNSARAAAQVFCWHGPMFQRSRRRSSGRGSASDVRAAERDLRDPGTQGPWKLMTLPGPRNFPKRPKLRTHPIRCFENLSVINIHPYINHVYIFIYNMYRHRHIISIFHGLIMLNPPLTEATFFMEHWAPGPGLHPGSGQQLQGRTAEASLTRDRLVGLHPQGKPIGKPMGNTCQGWIARNLTTGLGVVINLGKATRRFGGSSARDWWNYFRDWFSMPPIWRKEKRHQRSWEFTNN